MALKGYVPVGLLVLALAGGAQAAVAPAQPRAALATFVCQKALDPPSRGIDVTAVMRPVSSTVRLEVRFELLRERRPGGAVRVLRGGRLGKWVAPLDSTFGQRPGDVWRVAGPVANLPAPAYYRLRVTFRWLGTANVKLAQTVRTSPLCYQPELRPDLLVRSLAINSLPNQSGVDSYLAVVANRGASAAGAFQVQLSQGENVVQTRSISALRPYGTRRIRFNGPACAAAALVTVTVDPAHVIDEYDRANDSLSTVCPAAAAP